MLRQNTTTEINTWKFLHLRDLLMGRSRKTPQRMYICRHLPTHRSDIPHLMALPTFRSEYLTAGLLKCLSRPSNHTGSERIPRVGFLSISGHQSQPQLNNYRGPHSVLSWGLSPSPDPLQQQAPVSSTHPLCAPGRTCVPSPCHCPYHAEDMCPGPPLPPPAVSLRNTIWRKSCPHTDLPIASRKCPVLLPRPPWDSSWETTDVKCIPMWT